MNNNLTTRPISKLIRQLAIPASVGFFFNTMYNVVDTFYGGLISTEALAALSLSFPIFFCIIALGSGIGTGATALIANAIGEKRKNKPSLYAMQAISFTVLVAVVLTIAGLIASPYLFRILGASETYLSLSLSYMNIIFLATVFFMLTFTFNAILNAQGDSKTFRNYLIAGFLLNLILDPMFMYGWLGLPAMGLAGIAWATFLIEMFGAIYLGYKVTKTELFCKGCTKLLRPQRRAFIDISKQGFPAGLNMMTVALGIFIITFFVSKFGQEPVAAYGIATRIEQIFLLPTIGLNISTLAIVGQNNGAKKYDRIRETIKKSLKYGLSLLTIGTIIIFIFSPQLMGVFTDDATVIAIGAFYLRIAAFMTWAYVILHVCVAALQGLKKPMFALYMGIYRQILAPVIVFPIMIAFFGLIGIWWGIFITVWSGTIFTVIYVKRFFSAQNF